MHDDNNDDEPTLVSNRTMEIVVALLFIAGGLVVMWDSSRLGIGWKPAEGPAAGYFPFYIGLAMTAASLVNLVLALRRSRGFDEGFVSTPAFGRVMSVLIPLAIYVGLISFLGIYVASAIFIFAFMLYFGRDSFWKSALIGVAVPLWLFFMFERWFLVPLPKGPLEAALGVG